MGNNLGGAVDVVQSLSYNPFGLVYGVENKISEKACKKKYDKVPRRFFVRADRKRVQKLEVTICYLKLGRSTLFTF